MKKIFKILLFVFIFSCSSSVHKPPSAMLIQGEVNTDHYDSNKKSMVVSQGPHTTAAGLEMLEAGGNAVDAAVAISFTISVERPHSTGLGGGGFALVAAPNQDVIAFDFRERAPEKSKRENFIDLKGNPLYQKSQEGALAVATPGLVAGLYSLHQQYGKLPWDKVISPAIRLAEVGFMVYLELDTALKNKKEVLEKFPSTAKIFFKKGLNKETELLKLGDLLQQPDLAKTLKLIAKKGAKGFYYGPIAKNITNTIKKYQGSLTLTDLRKYQVKKRKPVSSKMGESFQGVEIFSMPPPSSGGIHVLQILNMVEANNASGTKAGVWSVDAIHETSLAMQQAFYDRVAFLGDSDFVKIPVNLLISKDYAQRAVKSFSHLARKMQDIKSEVRAGEESFETTHFSVIDKDGMTVSSTQTINGWFGSGLVAENTGIVLNNEMDDFALSVGGGNLFGAYGGEKNFIEPFKTPLSSMSPTIVMKNGKPFVVLGSPSGTRIITCVALTLLNYLYYGLPLSESVSASRYHQQWSPDELWFEKEAMNSSVIKKLEKKGHKVVEKELGCKVQAIAVHENNSLEGVSDIRGKGLAKGL